VLRRVYLDKQSIEKDLYISQTPILRAIKDKPGATQKEIADRLMVTPSCVVTSTKRLQKAGLIKKVTSKNNLRCNRLKLTEKGEDICAKGKELIDSFNIKCYENFSAEELEDFNKYLCKLLNNIEVLTHQDAESKNGDKND